MNEMGVPKYSTTPVVHINDALINTAEVDLLFRENSINVPDEKSQLTCKNDYENVEYTHQRLLNWDVETLTFVHSLYGALCIPTFLFVRL